MVHVYFTQLIRNFRSFERSLEFNKCPQFVNYPVVFPLKTRANLIGVKGRVYNRNVTLTCVWKDMQVPQYEYQSVCVWNNTCRALLCVCMYWVKKEQNTGVGDSYAPLVPHTHTMNWMNWRSDGMRCGKVLPLRATSAQRAGGGEWDCKWIACSCHKVCKIHRVFVCVIETLVLVGLHTHTDTYPYAYKCNFNKNSDYSTHPNKRIQSYANVHTHIHTCHQGQREFRYAFVLVNKQKSTWLL